MLVARAASTAEDVLMRSALDTLAGSGNLGMSTADIAQIFEHVACFRKAISAELEAKSLKNINIRANHIMGLLPRYGHIASDSAFKGKLATAQLLTCVARRRLADDISGLSMSIAGTKQLISFLGKAGYARTEVVAAESSLEMAQKTVTVLAACNAVGEFKNTSRGQRLAAALLAKACEHLPHALRKELETLRPT